MMTQEQIQNLQIGDTVAYTNGYVSQYNPGSITTVLKVHKGHGQITLADGRKFDRYGKEFGVEYGANRLWTVKALEETKALNAEKSLQQRQIKEVLDYIASHRCGDGNYNMTGEHKAVLVKKVAAITIPSA